MAFCPGPSLTESDRVGELPTCAQPAHLVALAPPPAVGAAHSRAQDAPEVEPDPQQALVGFCSYPLSHEVSLVCDHRKSPAPAGT